MATPESLPLGLDLEQQARYHIDFIAKVESVPELKQHAVLWRALYRYETFWLPLAAEHCDEVLSAPLDIEWIWHCHLLAPLIYAKDCMTIANKIVDHKLRSQEDYNAALERYETFWLPLAADHSDEVLSAPLDIEWIWHCHLLAPLIYTMDCMTIADKIVDHMLRSREDYSAALERYETFWLPLAAEHSDEVLSAPLDIEWIWHCHLLAPLIYAKDCMTIANKIVDHKLRSQEDYKAALVRSRTYWQQKYGDLDSCPFIVDYGTHSVPHVPNEFQSQVTYKVIEAAGRQKVFYYQVSLPHYKDDKFLKGSLLRYRQFLFLKTRYPKTFSVPCFEQDLMWHTHQLNPLIYREDTTALLGHVFNHDDTVNDRSEGSRLNNSAAETTAQWLEVFNEPYTWPGAMYRGQPPGGVLYKLKDNETNRASTKTSEVTLKSLTLKLPDVPTLKSYSGAIVSAHGCAGTRVVTKWFSLRGEPIQKHKAGKGSTYAITDIEYETNEETLTFNTRTMNSIRLDFETKTGVLGSFRKSKKPPMSFTNSDILSTIEHSNGANKNKRTLEIDQELDDGAELCLKCSFSEPVRGRALLFLQPSAEETLELPANVQSVLGPVAMERIPSGTDTSCKVTSIRLKNHVGQVDFTSKVLFLPAMMYSVVQIFHRDHMIAVAHPIGCEQLPAPSQVDDDIITLNHDLDERAILIKNNQGDWAILKGNLEASRADAAGNTGDDDMSAKLSLYLYKMCGGTVERTSVDLDPSRGASVRLDGVRVDLAKGVIEIDTAGTAEVGERIALAFCVSLLKKMLLAKKRT